MEGKRERGGKEGGREEAERERKKGGKNIKGGRGGGRKGWVGGGSVEGGEAGRDGERGGRDIRKEREGETDIADIRCIEIILFKLSRNSYSSCNEAHSWPTYTHTQLQHSQQN